MMISLRARSLLYSALAASLSIPAYLSWTISARAPGSPLPDISMLSIAASGLNIAILLGWIAFGISGGILISVASAALLVLSGFRAGCYNCNILIAPFLVTSWIGYTLAGFRNRMGQLYALRSDKIEEDMNILANEVKEKDKGIKAFEEKLKRYSTLKGVAERLSAVLSIEDITASIVDKSVKTLGKGGRVLLFLVDQDKQELMLSASNAKNHQAIRAKKGDLFDQWVLRHKKVLMVEDATKDFRFSTEGIDMDNVAFRSIISSPLFSGNKVTGILRMDSPNGSAYTQDDLRLLDIIANLSAVAIQNSLLYSRIQELAIRDGLTGLKVRRFFMENFHREIRRASRKKEPLSLLMLDIDHFKKYNDRYGHASGDIILKYIANTITELLDKADMAGRYGGEEMSILLWKKNKKEAVLAAEKIRKLVKNKTVEIEKTQTQVTVSIGVAAYPEDAVSEEELIRIADARLYKAKAAGRDIVCSD